MSRSGSRSVSPRFSLEEIAVRLREDICRLEYQRQRVAEELASPLRNSTIQRYEDMLIQRRLLLEQVEADIERLTPRVSQLAS
jgi:hypothetical protein